MLIKINVPASIEITRPTDLPKLREFMEDNNLKLNKSEIARQMKMDRRTVAKYLNGFEKSSNRCKPSSMDKYYETIKELLSSQTQIFSFRTVLYQYLCDNYGLTIPRPTFYHYIQNTKEFDQYFKNHGGARDTGPVIRYETAPGAQAQLDWKESINFILKDSGEVITINIMVLILGYSRMRIYRPAVNMTQDTLLHLLTESFEMLGGVPKEIVTDNMKTVMDTARGRYGKGSINKKFEVFAKDFCFTVRPCKAMTPQTKGKVESQMKYLEEIRAYSGKLNLVELYELIGRINRRVNNTICQGTGRIPILDFEKEKGSLQPLPSESVRNQYRISTEKVKVNTAGMISIGGRQYSVPPKYIGQTVRYQTHDANVHVYFNTELIAVHELTERKLNYIPEHYEAVLAERFPSMAADDVSRIAMENLNLLGGIYSNE